MAKKRFTSLSAERLNQIIEVGTDIQARTVYMWNEVTETSIRNAVKSIKFLENISPEDPIHLWVSTVGGDVYEMFALYDLIRTCSCPIITVGTGKVQSAGPLLLAAGTLGCRYITENCSVMIHEGESEAAGSFKQMKAEIGHMDKLNRTWAKLMASRTGKSEKWWIEAYEKNTDIHWTAKQAKSHGLVDIIIPEKDPAL